ncbi:unnamed protein product [Brassica rapa]|uniref:Uncharacterized protein n=1 Tax=Brassica campestris TaxID=3711 RepID=A0A3P6CKF9_BRACM|nr:unnamed protein product [Brassica rapa]VDD10955.1 unnamed protein product [Brassica rapa]
MIHNEIWNGSMGPLYTCISLVIIDEHWVFQRVLKAEEKWLRWRLSGIELRRNEGVGGGAQAVSRVGDGQVEASVDAWRADDEMSTRVPSP